MTDFKDNTEPQVYNEQQQAARAAAAQSPARFEKIKKGKATGMALIFGLIYMPYWCGKQWAALKKSDPRYSGASPFWRGLLFFFYMPALGKVIDEKSGNKKLFAISWFLWVLPVIMLIPFDVPGAIASFAFAYVAAEFQGEINKLVPEDQPYQRGTTLGDIVVFIIATAILALIIYAGFAGKRIGEINKCFSSFQEEGDKYSNSCLNIDFNVPADFNSFAEENTALYFIMTPKKYPVKEMSPEAISFFPAIVSEKHFKEDLQAEDFFEFFSIKKDEFLIAELRVINGKKGFYARAKPAKDNLYYALFVLPVKEDMGAYFLYHNNKADFTAFDKFLQSVKIK